MLISEYFLVDFDVARRYARLRIVMCHLTNGLMMQALRIGFEQRPSQSTGQIGTVARLSHIARFLMVDHFGNTAHVETHTGHTAGHRLHDGVGQVVFERGQHEHVGSIIHRDECLLVVDVA